MDIRNWSMDQILQLPDHCLSRRYSVFTSLQMVGDDSQWDISELGLPDRAIIHELNIYGAAAFGKYTSVRLALGDQLPTTTAEMDGLEPLFPGMGLQGPDPRSFLVDSGGTLSLRRLKMFLPAQGRRMVMECVAGTGHIIFVIAAIVVSAIPTEVPDWLVSV